MFDNKVFFKDNAAYHNAYAGEWVGNRSYNNALVGLNITLAGTGTPGYVTLEQWQAADPAHNDVGSTYKAAAIATQSAEIMAAARALLGL